MVNSSEEFNHRSHIGKTGQRKLSRISVLGFRTHTFVRAEDIYSR